LRQLNADVDQEIAALASGIETLLELASGRDGGAPAAATRLQRVL
jgi:hypothetical protein